MGEQSMTVIEVTDEAFESATRDGWALVDFYATWCPHCREFRPHYEAVAEGHTGNVTFLAADVDTARGAGERFSVSTIPTIVLLHQGALVARHSGVLRPDELADWLGRHTAG